MSGNLPGIVACAALYLDDPPLFPDSSTFFASLPPARATLFHFTAVLSRSAL
jgi:hypothetical protein